MIDYFWEIRFGLLLGLEWLFILCAGMGIKGEYPLSSLAVCITAATLCRCLNLHLRMRGD